MPLTRNLVTEMMSDRFLRVNAAARWSMALKGSLSGYPHPHTNHAGRSNPAAIAQSCAVECRLALLEPCLALRRDQPAAVVAVAAADEPRFGATDTFPADCLPSPATLSSSQQP